MCPDDKAVLDLGAHVVRQSRRRCDPAIDALLEQMVAGPDGELDGGVGLDRGREQLVVVDDLNIAAILRMQSSARMPREGYAGRRVLLAALRQVAPDCVVERCADAVDHGVRYD